MSRAEVRQQGAVTVRVAVLTDDESEHYFGASLADQGIQAVWLSVDNAGDLLLRFLPIITDPNYFSAPEVERLLRFWWRGSANASIAAVVGRAPLPNVIPQKRSVAGFVFTHREGGLKLLEVGLRPIGRCFVSGSCCRSAAAPHTPSKKSTLAAFIHLAPSKASTSQPYVKSWHSCAVALPTTPAIPMVTRSIL
jgi:hypothetical protein